MIVVINTIEHSKQRYNTVGDWYIQELNHFEPILHINVSKLSDWRYEMAIALHEQYEALLCYSKGITEKQVTDFDLSFEADPMRVAKYAEPGDDPQAPYYAEHAKALVVEHLFLADMDIVRELYNKDIDALYRSKN